MRRCWLLAAAVLIPTAISCQNISKVQAPSAAVPEEDVVATAECSAEPEAQAVPEVVPEADPDTYHPAPFLGEENDILLGNPLAVSYHYAGEESDYWVDLWFDEAGRIARRRTRSDFGEVEDATNSYDGNDCVYSEVVNENGTLVRKRELTAIEGNNYFIKETTPGLVREIWQEEITYLEGCYEVWRDTLLTRRVFFNDMGQELIHEEYDGKGHLKETATYTYDGAGNMLTCTIQDPREGVTPLVYSFTYRDKDSHGNWTVSESCYDGSEEAVGGILRRSIKYRE